MPRKRWSGGERARKIRSWGRIRWIIPPVGRIACLRSDCRTFLLRIHLTKFRVSWRSSTWQAVRDTGPQSPKELSSRKEFKSTKACLRLDKSSLHSMNPQQQEKWALCRLIETASSLLSLSNLSAATHTVWWSLAWTLAWRTSRNLFKLWPMQVWLPTSIMLLPWISTQKSSRMSSSNNKYQVWTRK